MDNGTSTDYPINNIVRKQAFVKRRRRRKLVLKIKCLYVTITHIFCLCMLSDAEMNRQQGCCMHLLMEMEMSFAIYTVLLLFILALVASYIYIRAA